MGPAALLVVGALLVVAVGMGATQSSPPTTADELESGTAGLEPVVLHPPLTSAVSRTAPPAEPTPTAEPSPEPELNPAPVADPVRVVAPSAEIDTRLVPLGLLPDGAMEVPEDASIAGWYEPGPEPGAPGPAVLAGHVDSRAGPGAFFFLGRLEPGDPVTVYRADGSKITFAVTAVEQHPKSALPVNRIWSDETKPVLRLVTCGGEFNRSTGHYTDNIVVFAELAGDLAGEGSPRLRGL